MPYSYTQLPGNGSNTNFNFSFGYLSRSHISVKVNLVDTPFTWLTDFSIQVTPAPAAGAVVEIRRTTPLNQPAVVWTDGSTLTEQDMNLDSRFNLYIAQEARDIADQSLQLDSQGVWDGRNRQTKNFGDPVDSTGLVTLGYFDNVYTPQLDAKVAEATTQANNAAASAATAQGYAAAADASADSAAALLGLFRGQYLGPLASDPTVDGNGQPVTAGDLYFNTTAQEVRVYTSTGVWKAAGSTVEGVLKRPPGNTPIIATAGQTVVPVMGGYDSALILVFVNGVAVSSPEVDTSSGTDLVFASPLAAGDEVDYFAFGAFLVANTYTKGEVYNKTETYSKTEVYSKSELNADAGSSFVGTKLQATGAVARTQRDKNSESVTLADFGGSPSASAAVNDAAFAAALAYLQNQGGGTLRVGPGNHNTSVAITSAADNIHIKLDHRAGIVYTSPDFVALKLTGQNCRVTGGHARGFIGPSAWDGTNVTPTYGAIWIGGNGGYVNTRLTNIRKVGVWFKDVANGTAEGCIIEGNYPSGQWTGVETVHYGIAVDPNADPSGGNFKILGNTIKGCVQGVFAGNYGTGGIIQGCVITGNIFEGCWNHGIYSNYTNGAIITGNSFNRCQIPVVASGRHNNVSGNTMFTGQSSGFDERDLTGISIRDPQFCVVANNTIRGTANATNSVIINLQYFATLPGPLSNNVVTGNTIEIVSGNAVAIRVEGTSGFGSTNVVNNIVANNNIQCSTTADGAILIDGPGTGSNHGNIVKGNNVTVTGNVNAGNPAINLTGITKALVTDNSVEWRFDSGTVGWAVVTVALTNCTFCKVANNSTVISHAWGANLSPYGVREFGTSNNNGAHYNNNFVDTTKSGAYTPVLPLTGSLMDVQEMGLGAPTIAARIGSTWRRYPFGAAGATFYVKESGTDGTGWTAK